MGFRDQYSHYKLTQGEETFTNLSKLLYNNSNLEELLCPLIKLLVETIEPADAGMVYIYDKKGRQLVADASYGYCQSDIKYTIRPKEGAPGQCYALRKSLLFSSAEEVIEQTATLRPVTFEFHAKIRQDLPPTLSIIVTPLILREKIFGVALLEHYKNHRAFSEADVQQLEALSSWISLIIDDIQSQLELKYAKRSYRDLLGKFIARTEEERRKIAREIHDDVNQLLLSVKLNLEGVESTLPVESARIRERLEVSRAQINQALDGLHELSLNLRPPALDELGLPQAVDWYIHRLSREAGLPITLEVTRVSQRRPALVIETEIFRILQEALSNVIKHSQATSAKVKLSFGKSQLVLLVEDNGIGFDTDAILTESDTKQNLGLLGMAERAELCGGTLKLDSTSGQGTRLKVEIPISSYDWGAY